MNTTSPESLNETIGIQKHKGGGRRKALIFCLEDKRYGIPLAKIKEVIGICPITPIPRVADFFKGMINLRGQIIAVIDLRIKFRLSQATIEPKKTSIIISSVGDIEVGTIVDEVIEVVAYRDDQLEPWESGSDEKTPDGVYAIAKDSDGSLTLLIDIEKSLEKTEFRFLKNKSA